MSAGKCTFQWDGTQWNLIETTCPSGQCNPPKMKPGGAPPAGMTVTDNKAGAVIELPCNWNGMPIYTTLLSPSFEVKESGSGSGQVEYVMKPLPLKVKLPVDS